MTARRGIGFGHRCLHHKPDRGVCMRRTAGGPCVSHVAGAEPGESPALATTCAVSACALPVVPGGRYCCGHARVMEATR